MMAAVDFQFILLLEEKVRPMLLALPFDQIVADDLLSHWMLHLQPRVHFHEPDAVGA